MAQEKKLSLQQSKFLTEYLANGENATLAAKACGYSEKSAAETGSELLKKPHVKVELEKRRSDLAAAHQITPQRIVAELARIAFLDTAQFFNPDGSMKPFVELPADLTRSISGFDLNKGKVRKIHLSDKQRALEMIAKMTGALKTDVHETNVQVVILPAKPSAPTIEGQVVETIEPTSTDLVPLKPEW